MSSIAKLKIPSYYRQRFLLTLLDLAGGKLSKMDFQKLLFLSQQEAGPSHYDFVPYFYGCYSFQAQSDVELLESRGWLQTVENEIQLMEESSAGLAREELARISRVAKQYKNCRGDELVRHVYEHHPYYAIHSKIAKSILPPQSYEVVVQARNRLKANEKMLFTIGYEGVSFEEYVNRLIRHDVRLLCDVRRNPLSRKFGFSKSTLSSLLPKLGIAYVHIPELGVASEKRSNLETESDYARLFMAYRESLPQQEESLGKLSELLEQHQRIALTCFEKQHESCHRHCISEYMEAAMSIEAAHL